MKNYYLKGLRSIGAILLLMVSAVDAWTQCSVGNPLGALDYADCNGIGGWAFDQANMNQTVTLDVYIDGIKTYSGIQANGDRQDLVGAFGTSAARYHGFNFSFPANAAWKNGQNHSFSVRICGASNELMASPKQVGGCTGGTQTPTPSGSCAYTEGQYLFTFNTEAIYAHFYNGVLYAGYQNGSNFKPQHWLTATGLMTQSVANCFAENDPHTSTTTTPTTNPTNTSTLPSAGSNFAGNLDYVDCNNVSGWILNKNTAHVSTKLDIYVNGWLVATNVTARVSRQDVANAFGISGYNAFGFNIQLPRNYNVGIPLTVSIKYAGTSTNIPGSPKTTAPCPSLGINVVNPNCYTQTTRFFPGSEPTQSPSLAHTGAYSFKLSTQGSSSVATLTSKLIPVRKNDRFAIEAYAFSPGVAKRNLTPQIASAIAGGLFTGVALAQRQSTLPDQRQADRFIPTLGLSTILMAPLVKSLLANQLPKGAFEVAFYDKSGKFAYRQQVKTSKTAREDWEQLQLETHALQDGYMVVRLKNTGKAPVYFDDISVQVRPGEIHNSSSTKLYSKLLSTRDGFDSQQNTTEQNIYRTDPSDDCGNGGESITNGGILLPEVRVTTVAWAPVNMADTAPTNTDHNSAPNNDFPPTSSSSGGQQSNVSNATPKIEIDTVSLNKCYAALVNSALKSGVNSEINMKINDLFRDNPDRTLTIKSGQVDGGVAGITKIPSTNGASYIITLDPDQLAATASQEYIASVLAHELAHVLVDEYDQNSMTPLTNTEEHVKIFESHVNDIADMLKIMFPSLREAGREKDAIALALGGLSDITKDGNGNINATRNAYAVQHYGISLAEAEAIQISYEANGYKGILCP